MATTNYILTSNGNFISEDELYHWGIKGMKWGVRRYQNQDGTLTPAGRRRYSEDTRYGSAESKRISDRDHSKSNKSALAWFALAATKNILTLNVPGLVFNSARLVSAGSSYVKSKVYDKERAINAVDKATGFRVKNKELTQEQDAARVNPLVHNFDSNTKNNCMLCTAAYDLRRRGYDVRAKKASYGYTTSDLLYWYPKAKINKVSGIDEKGRPSRKDMMVKVKSELVKQGDGARGNLMITWNNSVGGHSVAYEIQNGKLKIIDAQVNKVYNNPDSFLRRCGANLSYARLDNVEIDKRKIKEAAE